MKALADRLAADLEAAELDQRITAMQADVDAGLVPEGVRRPLFAHELQARTNFAGLENQVAREVDYLLRRAKADRARILALLDRDLRATALRPGPASPLQRVALRLFDLAGPGGLLQMAGAADLLDEAERYHRGRLEVAAGVAARRVVQEAIAQRLPVAANLLPKLDQLQADQLDLLARRIAQAPHVDLLRALRDQVVLEPKDFVTPDELVDRLMEHARGLSDAGMTDLANSAAQQADAMGRVAAAEALPVPKYVYASELLDRNTCGPCSIVDGREYETLADARRDYPHGTYVKCEGGLRCRGTLVFVWDTEADPTLPEPGDTPKHQRALADTQDMVHPARRIRLPEPTTGDPAYDIAARQVADALTALASLHRLPARAGQVPVIIGDLDDGTEGLTVSIIGGHTRDITVSITSPHPGFTFVHEAGHYIDWEAIGEYGGFASEHGLLDPVLQAIGRSRAVGRLNQMADEGHPAADEIRHYWLDPSELWARAYSQWVAERTGDRALLAAVRESAGRGPTQWAEDDFAPIGEAIDELMARIGFAP